MTKAKLLHRGRTREVSVGGGDGGAASATLDGRTVAMRRAHGEIEVDGRRFRVIAARDGGRTWVWCEGEVYEFEAARGGRRAAAGGAEHHAGGLAAPMPGRVRRLVAAPGASVSRGDVLLVLEAMKMEHTIRAPHDGRLERFHVAEGDLVEAGVELAELSKADAAAAPSNVG